MTYLIARPLRVDSTGAPANGEIFARVTALIPTDGEADIPNRNVQAATRAL